MEKLTSVCEGRVGPYAAQNLDCLFECYLAPAYTGKGQPELGELLRVVTDAETQDKPTITDSVDVCCHPG